MLLSPCTQVMRKSFLTADVLSAAGFIAVAVWVYRVSGTFRVPSWATVGAGFVPRVLAVLLIILSAILVLQSVLITQRFRRTESLTAKLGESLKRAVEETESAEARRKSPYFAPFLFALFVVYFLSLPYLGYFPTMVPGIVVLVVLIGVTENVDVRTLLYRGLLIAAGTAVVVHVVFQRVMYIRLPRGMLTRWLRSLF